MPMIMILTILCVLIFPGFSIAENDEELKFGFYVDRFATASHTLVLNDNLNRKIEHIGNKMARASETPFPSYTFRVINDPVVNAYSAAGGHIYINTGLLDKLENEDELAGVLGHEIVHTNKSHQSNGIASAERTGKIAAIAGPLLRFVLGVGVTALTGSLNFGGLKPDVAASASSNIAKVLRAGTDGLSNKVVVGVATSMVAGYSQDQELEADVLAVEYAHKAGYDPKAYVRFLKRLLVQKDRIISDKESYVSSLINAEPGLEKRIEKLEGSPSR